MKNTCANITQEWMSSETDRDRRKCGDVYRLCVKPVLGWRAVCPAGTTLCRCCMLRRQREQVARTSSTCPCGCGVEFLLSQDRGAAHKRTPAREVPWWRKCSEVPYCTVLYTKKHVNVLRYHLILYILLKNDTWHFLMWWFSLTTHHNFWNMLILIIKCLKFHPICIFMREPMDGTSFEP